MTQEQSQFIEKVEYALFGLGMANITYLSSLIILEDTLKALIATSAVLIVVITIDLIDQRLKT